MFKYKIGAQF